MLKLCLPQLLLLLLLAGCTSTVQLSPQHTVTATTIEQRIQQLSQLTHWTVKGKIAFIGQKKRQSANLYWQFNKKNNSHYQRIDLTTFLGINILHVESINNHHTIDVDGKTYYGNNLTSLIYQLTGITLPTNALSYWLKGLPYNDKDQLYYAKNALLPHRLTSYYHQQTWQVNYNQYRLFHGYQLPTKLTIKQKNLTIKIHINDWEI